MTREQKRAQLTYEVVKDYQEAKKEKESEVKSYGSMAHRFPALLRSAGLVQALAFVDARGKEPHRAFIQDLASVMLKLEGKNSSLKGEDAFKKLFEDAQSAELARYMNLTREALAVADWFKRFAQSVLKVEPGDES